jgi:nickel-dependent lactate racemase
VDIGALDGNPVSEAMFECARLCPPDFIINTVIAPDGGLAGVFAGEMDIAHCAACRLVEKISRGSISRKADLVIASAGTASNWIQSHKAFYNAHRAVHEKGWVILEAKCPEGIGDERFRYWVKKRDLAEIYSGLRLFPEVLGQTALSTRSRAPRTVLVTGMNKTDLADLGMRSAENLDSAVKIVLDDLVLRGIKRPSCYLMPDAMYVVPFLNRH